MTEKMDELKSPATNIDPSVNTAFVGDDGKVIIIDVPLNNVSPSSTIQVKQEIDYSTATNKSQFGAALAGNKVIC